MLSSVHILACVWKWRKAGVSVGGQVALGEEGGGGMSTPSLVITEADIILQLRAGALQNRDEMSCLWVLWRPCLMVTRGREGHLAGWSEHNYACICNY